MPVADTGVKTYFITTEGLLYSRNKGMSLLSANITRAIAPHFTAANRHQIAAENSIPLINRDTQALSLNARPTPVIDLGVITEDRHTSAGTAGLHPRRYGANKPHNPLRCHSIQVGGVSQL